MGNLKVTDFVGERLILQASELNDILAQRYERAANCFYLEFEEADYPMLMFLAKKNMASLHFFPNDQHPGYNSIGTLQWENPNGTVEFFMSRSDEPFLVNNEWILPFSKAVEAASEFYSTRELPTCIEWEEL